MFGMSIDDVCEHSSPLHFGFKPLNVANVHRVI